jgi:hypothetical protein
MSIRTTVVLDDDVLERVRERARERSVPFRAALNDLVRDGLALAGGKPAPFRVKAVDMGEFLLPYPIKVSDLDELEDKDRMRRLG